MDEYCKKFKEYFLSTYCDEEYLYGWQNFVKYRFPGTNNTLESMNSHLKSDITSFLKLKMGQFILKLFEKIRS